MAAVFKELVIHWDGKDHHIVPTMAILNRIESQGISLLGMAQRAAKGELPLAHVATAGAVLLNAAGERVQTEDVYKDLVNSPPDVVVSMVEAILNAAFPWQGKDEAPVTTRKTNSRSKKKT